MAYNTAGGGTMSAESRENVAWYRYYDRRVPWSDRGRMLEVYRKAERAEMVVLHVVPLYGENVCGLHVPNNLIMVTRSEAHKYRKDAR